MKNYGTIGPAAPDAGWVPAPRYLLRRARVLKHVRRLPPTDALEIGCGAGVLLHELDALGFRCTALEMSPEARELAAALAHGAGRDIQILEAPSADWEKHFPLLMAFEVLEHIEHDLEALQTWRKWMPNGGILLLSVPAHMAKWNPSDVWAGHFRRYERAPLIELLSSAGFETLTVECYGFPLANIAEKVRAAQYAPEVNPGVDETPEGKHANSSRSGIDRRHMMKWFPLFKSPLGKLVIRSAELAQRPFLSADIGNGYLVVAKAV